MATPYIKVAIQITEHPKILRTPRACRWAYIELLCYAARNLTDGFIPREYAAIVCTSDEIHALTDNRLLDPADGGWQIHDYLDWQTDSELIEKRRQAGRIGGVKSGASRRAKAKQTAKQTGTESKQTPHDQSTDEAHASKLREQEVEEEVEVEAKTTPRSTRTRKTHHAYPPDFEEFWHTYPRRQAKQAALKAYLNACRSVGRETVMRGARNYAADPNLPTNPRLIPLPATWLNDGRWDDDPCPPDLTQQAGPISAYMAAAAELITQEQTALLPAHQPLVRIAQ